MPEAVEMDDLLAGLNPPQREAVTHGDGPLLVLAGAGSGKTRVLTHRIAFLCGIGAVEPGEVLAITFTNKAAAEMRGRVELLLGRRTRAMWVMTFHSACARMLRVEAPRLGYTRTFTIYDQADARRLVKQCLDEAGVDPKRFTPAAVLSQISDAKNKLRDAEAYAQMVGSYFEQTVADVFREYERQLHRMNAMDFDDLLVRAVNVLELFPEVRERYSTAFRHVLVDEYQDTNHAQYRWLQLLAAEHKNLACVGDDDQCLVGGTPVRMGDGTLTPIEQVSVGDWVLSSYGAGDLRPARVTGVVTRRASELVAITTAGGRRIVSTPEHVHFAGWAPSGRSSTPIWGPTSSTHLELCGAGDGRHRLGAHTSSDIGALPTPTHAVARLGRDNTSLPFLAAVDVRPGMTMFSESGAPDTVTEVRKVEARAQVFDLNIEQTHNFSANHLLTHNSIYAFRGADVRNILEFQDDFPEARVVRLEQNYRSTQTILDAANAVISHNRGRMGKTLWTDVGEGDPIKVRELEDEHAEARFVAGEIDRLVDEGVSREEIAVFYRTNAQSRVLEDTLVRAQIAYQVIGGTKFYERAEIKDAIAYLIALTNPQDVVAFTRIANSPRRGLGQTSLSRVVSFANTVGLPVFEVAADAAQVPGLGAAAIKAFGRFMGTMRVLRERVEAGAPVAELLKEVLEETGYTEALRAERTFEAQGRLENLEELVNVATEYDEGAEEPSLDGFLQQIALLSDADTRRDDEGLVTLMTLHNAKGLEYPIVFIIGAEEGVFPHSRALDEGGLEEERRLAYVGITRAMRDLYITYARTRSVFGARTYGLRSRFVDEIPRDLTDREEPVGSRAGGRPRATSWESGEPTGAPAAFRLGDDVIHAAFGDGVVTGVEPGGIVVIRFARDATERKLVADLAPIEKR